MTKTAIVFNDTHIPYHDPTVMEIVLKDIKETQPDNVIINGDYLDCYSISRFDKDPLRSLDKDEDGNMMVSLQKELNVGYSYLKRIKELAPNAVISYVEGNHEFRLRRYILRNTPAFYGLHLPNEDVPVMSIERMLDLKGLGIEYLSSPTGEGYKRIGNLFVGHWNIARKHSAYTAKSLLDDKGVSIMQGHTHRGGSSYKTTMAGTMVGYENFCTCDVRPEYVIDPNWQNGYSKVRYDDVTGAFKVEQIVL